MRKHEYLPFIEMLCSADKHMIKPKVCRDTQSSFELRKNERTLQKYYRIRLGHLTTLSESLKKHTNTKDSQCLTEEIERIIFQNEYEEGISFYVYLYDMERISYDMIDNLINKLHTMLEDDAQTEDDNVCIANE